MSGDECVIALINTFDSLYDRRYAKLIFGSGTDPTSLLILFLFFFLFGVPVLLLVGATCSKKSKAPSFQIRSG